MNAKALAADILSVRSFKKKHRKKHRENFNTQCTNPQTLRIKKEKFYIEVCRLDASTDISQQMSCRLAQTEISLIIVNGAAVGCMWM